ncbi:MAG: LamG domain-containing protein [Caldilineaceae bacterium]
MATACGANGQIDRVYRWDNHVQGQKQLTELTVSCLLAEATAGQLAAACDLASNCATVETALSIAPQQSAKQTVQPIQDELSFLRRDTLPAPAVQPVGSFAQPMLVSYRAPYASSLRQDSPTAVDLNRGLVLHWALEEGPGNCTVQDQSGNALNGSFANRDCTTAWSTDVPPNRGHAYSLYLDGNADANAHLRSINSELLPAANSPRTLCAWAKSTDGSVNGWAEHVVNYGAATAENQAFGIMMYTGNTWYAYRHISDLNTQVVADTEWHQHCLVHDGATLSYYLDGQLAVAADATLDTAANTPFVVGVRPDLESHTVFDGWVDDLRLYNRALTAAEVQSLATLVASPATPTGQDATPGTADATAPTVLFAGDVLTTNAYSTISGLIFRGDVSSETGIVSATATLDLGDGPIALSTQLNPTDAPLGYAENHALYAAASWTATWQPDAADAPPDATNGTLTLTIYDASLTPTTVQQSVTLDLQTPNPGQLTILANGAPMVANRTYTSTQLSTTVLIPPIADAGGVTLWYGWTDHLTATLPLLTQASDPAVGLQLDQDFCSARPMARGVITSTSSPATAMVTAVSNAMASTPTISLGCPIRSTSRNNMVARCAARGRATAAPCWAPISALPRRLRHRSVRNPSISPGVTPCSICSGRGRIGQRTATYLFYLDTIPGQGLAWGLQPLHQHCAKHGVALADAPRERDRANSTQWAPTTPCGWQITPRPTYSVGMVPLGSMTVR